MQMSDHENKGLETFLSVLKQFTKKGDTFYCLESFGIKRGGDYEKLPVAQKMNGEQALVIVVKRGTPLTEKEKEKIDEFMNNTVKREDDTK